MAQQRQGRRMGMGGQAFKAQVMFGPIQHQQATAGAPASGQQGQMLMAAGSIGQAQGQGLAGLAHQAQGQRNHQGLLVALAGGGRGVLADGQLQGSGFAVPVTLHLQDRRAGLVVPAAELGKIKRRWCQPAIQTLRRPTGFGRLPHRRQKLITSGGRAVMALDIERHAAEKGFLTQQSVEHANQLRTLLINGGGVKVVNRLILIRLHRVGRRASIFAELSVAQHRNILDPIQRLAMEIGTEALITENSETLLERELKPVATGDAIACPIMKIFMGDHALNALQLSIGGGGGISEHQLGIKDIETLVFHGAHVEMAHSNNIEFFEVVFEAIDPLIPGHAALERGHRMGGERLITWLHVDTQFHQASAGGGEAVAHLLQLAGHQSEQVGGLGERIVPDGVMALRLGRSLGLRLEQAGFQAVAIAEEHREPLLISLDPHPKATEQIRPIRMKGDAPESLRLALGGHHATTGIEAFQGGVGVRIDPHLAAHHEGPFRGVVEHQAVRREPKRSSRQQLPIQRQALQGQIHPLQLQRAQGVAAVGTGGGGVRAERQPGQHLGMVRKEAHRQVGALQQVGTGPIVGKAHDGHGGATTWEREEPMVEPVSCSGPPGLF